MKVDNTEYLVSYPLLSITASSLRPIDITKLFHSSFVMLFLAFTAASFSYFCLFQGVFHSISSSGGEMASLKLSIFSA